MVSVTTATAIPLDKQQQPSCFGVMPSSDSSDVFGRDGCLETFISNSLSMLPCDQSSKQRLDPLPIYTNDLLGKNDYALLHDDFLESLLFEQIQKIFHGVDKSSACTPKLDSNIDYNSDIDDEASSFSFKSGISTTSSNFIRNDCNSRRKDTNSTSLPPCFEDETSMIAVPSSLLNKNGITNKKSVVAINSGNSNQKNNKSLRKQSFKSPSNKKMRRVSPPLQSPQGTPKSTKKRENAINDVKRNDISNTKFAMKVLELSKTSYPHPSCYIHDDCELQKDEGEGVTPGSNICVTGKDQCLYKLLQKMELVVQKILPDGNTVEDRKNSTKYNFSRKQAYVCDIKFDMGYVETRSKLKLRVRFLTGYLTMQYGILLRWDIRSTGKVNLVVLRKKCEDRFYTKGKVPVHVKQFVQTLKLSSASNQRCSSSSSDWLHQELKVRNDYHGGRGDGGIVAKCVCGDDGERSVGSTEEEQFFNPPQQRTEMDNKSANFGIDDDWICLYSIIDMLLYLCSGKM